MRANQSTIGHETPAHEAHLEESRETTLEAGAIQPKQSLHQRPGVRQLAKFCLVGASSTIIDQGTKFALATLGKSYAPQVPWWVWATISFCLAVTNGYFWNRKWTFQATSEAHGNARAQYQKFVLTNAVGLGLNLMFTKLFLIAFTGKLLHDQNPDPVHLMLASLCAVPVVVIWNFCAAKFWTFKPVKH